MKILYLNSGFQLLISNEQSELLDKFQYGQPILKKQLTEREQYLATELVHKGALTRCMVQNKLAYCKPDPEQVWRI
jgi:hypothetical protein